MDMPQLKYVPNSITQRKALFKFNFIDRIYGLCKSFCVEAKGIDNAYNLVFLCRF